MAVIEALMPTGGARPAAHWEAEAAAAVDGRGGNAGWARVQSTGRGVNDCGADTALQPSCAPSCARPPRSWEEGRSGARTTVPLRNPWRSNKRAADAAAVG
jgi:hypothetical protein